MNKQVLDDIVNQMYEIIKEDLEPKIYEKAARVYSLRKEEHEKSSKEAEILYDKITYEEVEKHIKKDLPLIARLFCKITVNGKKLVENEITYMYYFNNKIGYIFQYSPPIEDMKKW